MVDLQSQYIKIQPQIDAKINEVVQSAAIINGPEVHKFQEELEAYLGVKHVIPCANGTDALQIAMMGLDLKPGDEVITVDFTFAATVEVIALLHLTPVLVDVETVVDFPDHQDWKFISSLEIESNLNSLTELLEVDYA